MKPSKARRKACICISDHSKKTKKLPPNFVCKCTASVIDRKYLDESQVLIESLPLVEVYKLNLGLVQRVARDHRSLRNHLYKFAELLYARRTLGGLTEDPVIPPAPASSPDRSSQTAQVNHQPGCLLVQNMMTLYLMRVGKEWPNP